MFPQKHTPYSPQVQLGYSNATYHWPAFAKDTLKRSFILKRKRDTKDGLNSIFTFACALRNQRGKVCLFVLKLYFGCCII